MYMILSAFRAAKKLQKCLPTDCSYKLEIMYLFLMVFKVPSLSLF